MIKHQAFVRLIITDASGRLKNELSLEKNPYIPNEFMLELIRKWWRQRLHKRAPIPENIWLEVLDDIPILMGLSEEERTRLRALVTIFVHEKSFLVVNNLELSTANKVLIAAHACYPILNLDFSYFDGWMTLIVYPRAFLQPRHQIDASGVMHEWKQLVRGEAWQRGPITLAWADVEGSGVGDGYNVIIHEIAHQLDMRNGVADGYPPLPKSMQSRDWYNAFTSAYQQLTHQIQHGHKTHIDPYAGESPAEFFAVISEYFFEKPSLVEQHYPVVYALLKAFYQQDPLKRLHRSKA